jgi:formylglycine-generating enzyme required for sulfatase activity
LCRLLTDNHSITMFTLIRYQIALTLLLLSQLVCRAQPAPRTLETKTIPSGTERRLALVIGNKDYQHVRPLKNTLNDANDMKVALEKLGFDVTLAPNTSYQQLTAALNRFRDKLTPNTVALVYYSGHGVSYNGKNYLLPVDVSVRCLEDIEEYGISLNRILGDLTSYQVRNSFVLLDACRDLPDLQPCDKTSRGDLDGQLGLVRPTNNPKGSMVVFATREGSTADDNVGERNGLFTKYLLQHLTTPNLGIRRILDLTKRGVSEASKGRQNPGRYDELDDDFVFVQTQKQPVDLNAPPVDLPVGPAMVRVEGGTFQMGSNEGEADERPVHSVTVSSFMLGKYEVTVGEYMQFAEETNSHYPEWLEAGSKYHIETGTDAFYKDKGYTNRQSRLPIVGVSHDDAVAYCAWLRKKTGLVYRLPTEAEWEYAARGGMQSRKYSHAGSNNAGAVGWNRENSDGKPHEVGGKGANELGLYDMSGNVREWCGDWYGGYRPTSQTNPTGPGSGSSRVLRGGSWYFYPQFCRVADRNVDSPQYRDCSIGFRVLSQAQ